MYKTVQINSSNANDDKEIRELYETREYHMINLSI